MSAWPVDLIGDQYELIAAGARQRVALAQDAAQAVGHFFQQFIAAVMAERIVDHLEAVQIDHQHGDTAFAPLGIRDRLRQAVVEQQTIRQLGERIVRREMLQAGVGIFQATAC